MCERGRHTDVAAIGLNGDKGGSIEWSQCHFAKGASIHAYIRECELGMFGHLEALHHLLAPWRLLPVSGTAATGAAAAAEPPFFPFFVVGFFVLPFVFFSFFALAFLSFLLPVRGVGEVSAGSVSSLKVLLSILVIIAFFVCIGARRLCTLARCCSAARHFPTAGPMRRSASSASAR